MVYCLRTAGLNEKNAGKASEQLGKRRIGQKLHKIGDNNMNKQTEREREREREIAAFLTEPFGLGLSTNLAREWLQIDTDITSTADELSGGTNIDDLE